MERINVVVIFSGACRRLIISRSYILYFSDWSTKGMGMEQKPDYRENKIKFKTSLAKRKKIKKQMAILEKEIFKYETLYLELTQGSPLTKNVEYYVSNRTEKKKYAIDDKARIFSKNFPTSEK